MVGEAALTITAITMPDIGADQESIEVSAWLVQAGDTVTIGDRVVEVLIDGVTFDITADSSGVIRKIDAPTGTVVQTGMTLGWVSD